MESPDVRTVLAHLRVLAKTKRGMFIVAIGVKDDSPARARQLLEMIQDLSESADTLVASVAPGSKWPRGAPRH